MSKKVYEIAKEFGVQSKDFTAMLQEINIPVKNHMSVMSEQQEKYFRNNFSVEDGKIIPKSQTDVQELQKTDRTPAQEPQGKKTESRSRREAAPAADKRGSADNKTSFQPRQQRTPAADGQRRPQGQSQDYRRQPNQGQRDASQRQPNQRPRDDQRRRDDQRPRTQSARDDQRPRTQAPRDDQRPRTQAPRDAQRQQRPPYTPRDQQRGGTQKPWDKDKDAKPRTNQSQKPAPKKAAALPEKAKTEKSKKESKQKNEQRYKAKENFFNDDKTKRVIDNTKKTKGSKADYKKKKIEAKEERMTRGVTETVTIPETIMVSELAEKILISPAEIIKILMSYGVMANINQTIDFETASIICEELGIAIKLEEDVDIVEEILVKQFEDPSQLKTRAPIITVMGHVDHGKTSLLDTIRHTNVISEESGGITQHIGAYTITAHGKSITFIDTPGHEAFTSMRSRGASITDIAVLVIAADDGIKPQTVEAINHAKSARVPILVAINKIDKPEANVEKVKQELTEYGLVAEEWGGDTICVPVSAKQRIGIDELLDSILLIAEVEDLKANFNANAVGTIIEARVDAQRGITASLLIKSGMLRESDIIVTGKIYGKVRAMANDLGQKIVEAEPSRAVEILGFNEVPSAGDKFFVAESEREAKKITDRRKDREKLLQSKAAAPVTFDELFNKISQDMMKEIKLIIKADVQGSFEAIKQSLEKLNGTEQDIRVNIIHGGVGAVNESDVALAAASQALLIAFNVKSDNNALTSATKESVEIRTYEIIYDIIDDIEKAMRGMREPEYREVSTAKAEVRMTFKVPDLGIVAGCYILSGTVSRKDKLRVIRDGKVIHTGQISSLKRFKDDVKEVAAGYECGIGVEKYNGIQLGDIFEFFRLEQIPVV